ncbi:MAG: AEC family transporter [Chloroflexota bacterium]|nr:AEC family transporter [Chloroflexota bacterium]
MTNIMMPVVLVVFMGMALRYFKKAHVGPLSQAALYLFSPALVFRGMATTDLPLESMGKIVVFAILLTAIMFIIAHGTSLAIRLERSIQSAIIMAVLFMNAGNLPLPIIQLAFGDAGLERALVFFTIQALITATLGVFIAARGSQGATAALKAVAGQPIVYAAIAGVAVNLLEVTLPQLILKPTELLANAAFPAMLLVLGGNLVSQWSIQSLGPVVVATVLRLWVGLAVAYGLLELIGFDGITKNVLLVQSATPTAVIVIVLSTEFNSKPAIATGAVVVSTIASIPTLTILLSLLTQ